MAGNSFGELFRITTFGESHGGAVGVVIDGCPPGLALSAEDIQTELDRRRPGQSALTSPRKESDQIRILSGVFEDRTTGTPIMLMALNQDARPEEYEHLKSLFRPSHADFTYLQKYGVRDWRGSGRASARETLGRVAAGAVAKKLLAQRAGIQILSFVQAVGEIEAACDLDCVTLEQIESNPVRCPDTAKAGEMIDLIQSVAEEGDSIGGIICGVVKNAPAGLGEPVFDKLHADLGKAMLSINAAKGFEIGLGFKAARMRGSAHNDPFGLELSGKAGPLSNNAGGVLGGISSGAPIYFRVAFKPVATIRKEQDTLDLAGRPAKLAAAGRHDACVLPRAVPIVDAMAALVVADHYLRQLALR